MAGDDSFLFYLLCSPDFPVIFFDKPVIFFTKVIVMLHSRRPRHRHGLQTSILLWTLCVSLFLACFVGGVSLFLSRRYLKESLTQSSMLSLSILGEEIQADLENVTSFASWITLDAQTAAYLTRAGKVFSGDASAASAEESNDLRSAALSAWTHLNEEYRFSSVHDFIGRFVVSIPSGEEYLQLVLNPSASTSRLMTSIMEAPFFETHLESPVFLWDGVWDNPVSTTYNPQILPVVRPIKSFASSGLLGFVYLEVSGSLLSSHLTGIGEEEDSVLYLTFQDSKTYACRQGHFTPETLPENVISYTLKEENITLSLLPSQEEMLRRWKDILILILGVVAIILASGIILSLSLRKMIVQPIDALLTTLEEVGRGSFTHNQEIEWDNELGDIGRGINRLSGDLNSLMDKRLQDEAANQEMKYQMLLYQINPHFIYNTLGAIKWMASLQGSQGIAEISTALAGLLKSISKGTEDVIDLRAELDLLKDYFTIMNYRYGGTIDMEIDLQSEDLLEAQICRFSLQPIVENAIFHGIEPKGTAGRIDLKIFSPEEGLLKILVTDDGVGMEKETIDAILAGEAEADHDFFRHVGIGNVHSRTKHTFGESYGLSIESEPDKYTCVTLTLPLKTPETQETEGEIQS